MNHNKLWTLQFQDSTNPQHFLIRMVEVKTPVLKAIEMAHSIDKLNEVSYIMDANGMLTEFHRFKGLLNGLFCDTNSIVTLFNKKWMSVPENSEDTGSDFGVTSGTLKVDDKSSTGHWTLYVHGPLGNHDIPITAGCTIREAMEHLNIDINNYHLANAFLDGWDAKPHAFYGVTIEYIGAKIVEEPAGLTWPSFYDYTETANSIKAAMQRFDAEFGDKDMSLFEKSVWTVIFYTGDVEMKLTLSGMDISEAMAEVSAFVEKHKNLHVFTRVEILSA